LEATYDLLGGSGEFAILSATSTAANKNAWIAAMQEIMAAQPRFANPNLVRVAFGEDLRDKQQKSYLTKCQLCYMFVMPLGEAAL